MFVFRCISEVNVNFCAAAFLVYFHSQQQIFFFLLSGHVTECRVTEYFGGWSVMDLVARKLLCCFLHCPTNASACLFSTRHLNDRYLQAMLSLANKFTL